MRQPITNRQFPLTVALLISTAVLAVVMPVSARADEPGGETTTLPSDPTVQVTTDGDLILRSQQPAVTTVTRVTSARHAEAHFAAVKWLKGKITKAKKSVNHWSQVMGKKAPNPNSRHLASLGLASLSRTVKAWQELAKETRVKAQHPPHLQAFLCIHHYEGSWTDSGSPYYGGLQMDLGFQHTYAPWLLKHKGTADHWTPLEQIWAAEKAAKSRGFWPWPNTARDCGLL